MLRHTESDSLWRSIPGIWDKMFQFGEKHAGRSCPSIEVKQTVQILIKDKNGVCEVPFLYVSPPLHGCGFCENLKFSHHVVAAVRCPFFRGDAGAGRMGILGSA